ncbi:DUF7848 domain-containing protein [Streptomyces sp. NPDC001709]
MCHTGTPGRYTRGGCGEQAGPAGHGWLLVGHSRSEKMRAACSRLRGADDGLPSTSSALRPQQADLRGSATRGCHLQARRRQRGTRRRCPFAGSVTTRPRSRSSRTARRVVRQATPYSAPRSRSCPGRGGVVYEAYCTTPHHGECSGPWDAQEAAQDWTLRHTGRTGHPLLRRVVIGHAG